MQFVIAVFPDHTHFSITINTYTMPLPPFIGPFFKNILFVQKIKWPL